MALAEIKKYFAYCTLAYCICAESGEHIVQKPHNIFPCIQKSRLNQ